MSINYNLALIFIFYTHFFMYNPIYGLKYLVEYIFNSLLVYVKIEMQQLNSYIFENETMDEVRRVKNLRSFISRSLFCLY